MLVADYKAAQANGQLGSTGNWFKTYIATEAKETQLNVSWSQEAKQVNEVDNPCNLDKESAVDALKYTKNVGGGSSSSSSSSNTGEDMLLTQATKQRSNSQMKVDIKQKIEGFEKTNMEADKVTNLCIDVLFAVLGRHTNKQSHLFYRSAWNALTKNFQSTVP
jgi:E3 ubiquitin-protein ligase DOA10